MAIRLTESRLRQIIREEAARLTEANYFTPGKATAMEVPLKDPVDPKFADKVFRAYEDLYTSGMAPTVGDIQAEIGPIPRGQDIFAALEAAGLAEDPDEGTVYEKGPRKKPNVPWKVSYYRPGFGKYRRDGTRWD